MALRSRFLTPGEAAAVLGISPSGARWMADTRQVRTMRTPSGRRLLSASDVERLRRERVNQARRSAVQ